MNPKPCENPEPLAYQYGHLAKIQKFLKNQNFYFDNSDTGLGKTYANGFVTRALQLDEVFVVCPKSVLSNWTTVMNLFKIPIVFASTYESFRGTEKNPPKHGYLSIHVETHEDLNNKTIKKVTYQPTDKFKKLVENKKLMFVFDEFHRCKNDSLQCASVAGMNRYLRSPEICDRVYSAFLTATTYTEVSSSWNLFRAAGLSQYNALYEHSLIYDNYELLGYEDVVKWGKKYDQSCSSNLGFFPRKQNIEQGTHDILTSYIFPHTMSAMPRQDYPYEILNQCIVANDEVSDICKDLISAIMVIVRNNRVEGMGNLRLMMHLLEIIKAFYVVKMACEKLESNPNCKVVIFVNYLDVLSFIKEKMKAHHPLILNGQTSSRTREQIIKLFNRPDTKERVFISILQAGGVGISLHDENGGFPRTSYIMADYQLIALKQGFGRTIREGMKSEAEVNLMYMMPYDESLKTEKSVIEFKVFKSLHKKSEVLRESMAKENKLQKLPCDLELTCKDERRMNLNPREHIEYVLNTFNESKLENFKKKVPWVFNCQAGEVSPPAYTEAPPSYSADDAQSSEAQLVRDVERTIESVVL